MQQGAVRRRRGARWLLAASVLAALAVGTLSAVSGAATQKPVVIGFVGAKSGFMSIYDQQVYVGAQVAANAANAKGGVLGGRKIKFITCDAKTNQAQGAVCAQDVLSKGADFVMPSCDFDFGSPAARVANKAGKIAIGCAGGLAYGVQGVGPLTYNTYSGSATEGAIMAEWAYKKMGWRHPYVITDTYLQYTKDVGTYFNKRWTQLAGKDSIAGQDTFNNTDASVAAQISRLRSAASKADFVVVSSLPPGGPSAIRQIRGAGINLPIVAAAAFDGSYWLSSVPKLSKFYYPALGSLYGDDPNPARAKLLYKDFKKVSGKAPSLASYPLLGYAAVQTLVDGMKKANSAGGTAVEKALDSFHSHPLITGPTTYTAKCHIPSGRPYLIMQVQNGKPSYTGVIWKPASVPPHPC